MINVNGGVNIDGERGVAYIALKSAAVAKTLELPAMVNVDYAADGSIVGIELIYPPGYLDDGHVRP